MASRYELGITGGVGTSGVASAELRAGSADAIRLKEVGVFLNAATASTLGLGKPAAIGVTPTSPILGQTSNGGAAAVGATAIAWGTPPTIPTQFYRRIGLPAAIGNGIIWTFQGDGLLIPASGSIVIWNLASNSIVTCYFVWEE